jgi:hypothetical protein
VTSLNLLLGVGGTGAKVVESALQAFLAGLGPQAVQVGFVDQDEANGNVKRARGLLGRMVDFQRRWTLEGEHGFDRSPLRMADPCWVRCRQTVVDDHELWCPHSEQGTTLAGISAPEVAEQESPALKGRMDLLYAPDDTEQFMDLGVGLPRRPHIGRGGDAVGGTGRATAPFWRGIRELLGPGAAGPGGDASLLRGPYSEEQGRGVSPPLLGIMRALDQLRTRRPRATSASAAALMLPYFAFGAPEDFQAPTPCASGASACANPARALKYYHELFRHEAVFRRVLLAGWNPSFQLGYHSAGSTGQANPPLPPELLAAMAAARFFDPERTPAVRSNATFVSARARPKR